MNTPPEFETRALERPHSRKVALERREREATLLVPDAEPSFPDILQAAFYPEEFNCERSGF